MESLGNGVRHSKIVFKYVPGLPISVYADASNYANNGVVQQLHPDGRERVIDYLSRGLKGAGISHKECLALTLTLTL